MIIRRRLQDLEEILEPALLPNPRFHDLTNQEFGRWTVISFAGKIKGNTHWKCLCNCGESRIVATGSLNSGRSKSCGCLNKEIASASKRTHGESREGKCSDEYQAYRKAKNRCQNPRNHSYKDYGGRGIEFRFNSFSEFLGEVGRKPSKNHSIDRINNNGHYEKGNLKWSTQKEQNFNQRTNHLISIGNETRCLTEWAELKNIKRETIQSRISRGWCDPCSVTIPVQLGRCKHMKSEFL